MKILDYLWKVFPSTMNNITYNNLTTLGKVIVSLFIIIPIVATVIMVILYTAIVLLPYALDYY